MTDDAAVYPNLLIISNLCLSQNSANGRTLRNFLIGWPIDKIAQFYIHKDIPDFSVCKRYFCMTDAQAVHAFLGKHFAAEIPVPNGDASKSNTERHIKRNAATMLAREIVWNSRRWMTAEFENFVESFSPNVILLQAGDCAFMCSLAEDLAEKHKIPLIVYNSESYYFNDFDYFRGNGFAHWLYPLFRRFYRRKFEQMMHAAAKTVYICSSLQARYDAVFGAPSETIYTATEMVPYVERVRDQPFTAVYLGNLDLGRHKSLIELANVLHSVSAELYLDVYGHANKAILSELERCAAIRYHGLVPYGEVQCIMRQSSMLVHAESFEKAYKESLQFAFSTKIPDSLASGTCFLLYAPEEMACTKYLNEHEAAYVVSDRESLKSTLELLVQDPDARTNYVSAALRLAAENHDAKKNADRFQEVLRQAVNDKK